MRHLHWMLRAIGLIGFVLLLASSAWAQQCSKRTTLIADTDVFENPPTFVTGAGWRGNIQARLSSGTEVFVCRERSIDFGFSSKTWMQIAYRSGQQWPKYGWVIKEAVRSSSRSVTESSLLAFFIGTAQAQESPDNRLPETPPPVPPLPTNSNAGAIGGMSAGTSDLFGLYLPLFAAMVLGMCAKVVVDLLDSWDKGLLWGHLRNGIVAILVSPIVFLGLLSAGQFSGNTQTFVVLALLAFQNGFFWQTVLKRESDRTGERTILGSKRPR
jgi:hypothetical protein